MLAGNSCMPEMSSEKVSRVHSVERNIIPSLFASVMQKIGQEAQAFRPDDGAFFYVTSQTIRVER